MYETLDEADFRLNHTVVWYKDSYSVVRGTDRVGKKIHLYLAPSGDCVPIDSPDLKIRNIPTGYINVDGNVTFIYRRPTRRYRQGLRGDNSRVSGLDFDVFKQLIVVGKVSTQLKTKEKEIINRDFLLIGNDLYYREDLVGRKVGDKFGFHNEFSFLKECFEEVINGD